MDNEKLHREILQRLTAIEVQLIAFGQRMDISNGRIAKLENGQQQNTSYRITFNKVVVWLGQHVTELVMAVLIWYLIYQ